MNEHGHDRWADEVAAYMLGALEPDEISKLEAHLERCELCREQMRWLAPAVGALPESVKRIEPPPGLRDRVLGEAEIFPRSSAPLRGLRERMRVWARGFGSRGKGWRPALAATLAVLALFAVVAVSYEIGAQSGEFEPATVTYSGESGEVEAVLTREGDSGKLELSNVAQPKTGKVLEAWVRRGDAVEPVPALFVPNGEERAWTMIEGMEGVDAVLVTEEPLGGSSTPTAEPMLTVEISEPN